jgi:FkbM family methyltransferase
MAQNTEKFKLGFELNSYLEWFLRRIYRTLKKSGNFILLSSPLSKNQMFFDRKRNENFSIIIRDKVDLKIVNDTFSREDYGIHRLARYDELVSLYNKFIADNRKPLIVDLGANCGLASLYFSRKFKEAQIIGIEPDKGNYKLATFNCSQCANISFIHSGISSEDGKGDIINSDDANWSFRTKISDKGSITMLSMNTLLNDASIESCVPFIVKIDIEGFEQNLFEKNTEWIDKFPLLIIELHDWMLPNSANSQNFLKCISKLNRDFIYINENVFSIKNT